MPVKDDLSIQGRIPPIAGTKSSPEQHPTSPGESPNSESNLIAPKLPVVRGRPRARTRKSHVSHTAAPPTTEIPCSWVPSNRQMLEDKESAQNLQLYGTKSGLHLPDIADKKSSRNMMKIRPKTPQIRTIHVNAADDVPLQLPALVNNNQDMRGMYVPRPPSHSKSPRLVAPHPPPSRSPRDISAKSPFDICDPAREYRDYARDNEGPMDGLPRYHYTPHPPGHYSSDNVRRAPRHLPPLWVRIPTNGEEEANPD